MPYSNPRGVVVRDGREIACACFCHLEPALHFMPCCHDPTTDQGRASVALAVELDHLVELHGGVSAHVQRYRLTHPELDHVVDTVVAHWRRGRL